MVMISVFIIMISMKNHDFIPNDYLDDHVQKSPLYSKLSSYLVSLVVWPGP